MSTPLERQLKKELKTIERTARMDKELQEYGRRVQGGTMWTVGDLQRFFRDTRKRKRRR